ncbi:hypothetical protein KDA00_04225 [Candidatus Saccharibacteria bacterium]|nr:hypothetical protein [Candidatus Saccharibacteria bacterium]
MIKALDFSKRKRTNTIRFIVAVVIIILAVPSFAFAIPPDVPSGSTIEQRIKQRLQEQKVELNQKELVRYKSRCIGTQNTVRDIQSQFSKVSANRQAVYKKIDAKLWIIIGQLKLAGKDTFQLETQRGEFANKMTTYTNTLNQYNQTLDDIVVMNCQADLNGFIALVKTAREYQTSLRDQSNEMRTHIVDTVKKTLSDFATELQPEDSRDKDQ